MGFAVHRVVGGKELVVFFQRRAATGGIGNHGVKILSQEYVEIRARELASDVTHTGMGREGAAGKGGHRAARSGAAAGRGRRTSPRGEDTRRQPRHADSVARRQKPPDGKARPARASPTPGGSATQTGAAADPGPRPNPTAP